MSNRWQWQQNRCSFLREVNERNRGNNGLGCVSLWGLTDLDEHSCSPWPSRSRVSDDLSWRSSFPVPSIATDPALPPLPFPFPSVPRNSHSKGITKSSLSWIWINSLGVVPDDKQNEGHFRFDFYFPLERLVYFFKNFMILCRFIWSDDWKLVVLREVFVEILNYL